MVHQDSRKSPGRPKTIGGIINVKNYGVPKRKINRSSVINSADKAKGDARMRKTRLYKNVSLWLLAVFTTYLVLTGRSGIAQKEDDSDNNITTRIIHYDWVDDKGVLKGGTVEIKVDLDRRARVLESEPNWNVETIIDNGDPNNRVDLVIVGDGYDVNDINDGIYKSHVNSVINRFFLIEGFFSESPLDEYASFFNVHRVDVISVDSGVSYDPCDCNCLRNTALGMRFHETVRRYLYIDVNDEPNTYAAADLAPDSDTILALANTETYGGSGFYYPYQDKEGLACLAGGNEWRIELGLHEFGHSFVNLGDEYFDPNGVVYTGDEPAQANLSIYEANDMNDWQRKWYR